MYKIYTNPDHCRKYDKTVYSLAQKKRPLPKKQALLNVHGLFAFGCHLKIDLAKVDIGADDGDHHAVAQAPGLAGGGVRKADASVRVVPVAVRLEAGTKPSTPFSSSTKMPRWVTPEMIPS